MEDPTTAIKPRKLMRFVEKTGNDAAPGADVTNLADLGTAERPGSDSENDPELTLPERREEWYGAKFRSLKETVEQLRKSLQDKERDYLRLKNKYSVSKRRQENLQEEINKQNASKLDSSSELEFLRLQLIEREKELAEQRTSYEAEIKEIGGNIPPEVDCGKHDLTNGVAPLENCLSRSVFEARYLALHKDTRRKLLYGIFGLAFLSSIVALGDRSTVLSTAAVGLWTLGVTFLWNERKELFRTMKIKHLTQVRELTNSNAQLRQERSNLEAAKNRLEESLSKNSSEKETFILKMKALSVKIGEERAKNEELAKQAETRLRELESERVSRRLVEQRLEEVTAQAQKVKERAEMGDCGEAFEKLRETLGIECEQKEKLKRENEKLVQEIVEMNTKEEKWKIERKALENRLNGIKENHEGKGVGGKENGGIKDVVDGMEVDGLKQDDMKNDQEAKDLEAKVVGRIKEGEGSNVDKVDLTRCWLCGFSIPRETRVALYVVFLACFVTFLHSAFTSKFHFILGLSCLVALSVGTYLGKCKKFLK